MNLAIKTYNYYYLTLCRTIVVLLLLFLQIPIGGAETLTPSTSNTVNKQEKRAIILNVSGAIGPAIQDYIQRGIEYAKEKHATLIILQLDTPGGLETAMRVINKLILASPIPIVTYVAPSGARAASAGTFILYASHIAAMAPGTNVGAASPVNLMGGSETRDKKSSRNIEEEKATEDASAYIRGLAALRSRNVEWAEKAVREAVSLSADEALKIRVINLIASDIPDLLQKINHYTVRMPNNIITLQTDNITLETINPDWRFEFLKIITDPTIAYVLLLIGIYGLFFEFSNPGLILPGVAGAIALLIALYAFQLLPINYVGFTLLLLGILFMVAEVFLASFGALGIGGIVAFATGSVLLLDTNSGFGIAWQMILIASIVSGVFFLIVMNLAFRSMRRKGVSGKEAIINHTGTVIKVITANNSEPGISQSKRLFLVKINGEIWKASSDYELQVGQEIRVTQLSGLLLIIEPLPLT